MTDTIVRAATTAVYEARKARVSHPEGSFDKRGRFYPSAIEDADGDGTRVRSPSASWPYSYMLRCHTRAHCATLVRRALAGHAVPADVRDAVARATLLRAA